MLHLHTSITTFLKTIKYTFKAAAMEVIEYRNEATNFSLAEWKSNGCPTKR